MKKIANVIIVLVCLVFMSVSVFAQKKITRANYSNSVNATKVDKRINLNMLKQKQDERLGQMTGRIINSSGLAFEFGEADGKYTIELFACSYKSTTSSGGLINSGISYDSSLVKNGITVAFEKINDTLTKYTAYNIPVNKQFIIGLTLNETYTSPKGNINNTNYGNLSKVKILNAYYYYQIAYTGANLQITRKINYPSEVFKQDIILTPSDKMPN